MTQTFKPPDNSQELKQIVDNLDTFDCCLRTELDQTRYELFKKTKGAKAFINQIIYKLSISETGYYQTISNFPYSYLLENLQDIRHSIVWFKNRKIMNENLEHFKTKGVILINQSKKQSIKDIPHLHLFVEY
jgi:hypothetical protein